MTSAAREAALAGFREKFIDAAQSAVREYAILLVGAGLPQDEVLRLTRDYMNAEIFPWFRDALRKMNAVVDFAHSPSSPSPSEEVH